MIITQIGEQIDDLRLDGDIQCGDGLIGNNKIRVENQCAGNTDSLALSPGEFMGKTVVMLGSQPANLHYLNDFFMQFRPATEFMFQHRLANGIADADTWIERAVRVLKHQLNFWP